MAKLILAFRNFANAPKNVTNLLAMKEFLTSILEGASSGERRGRFYVQLKCCRFPLDRRLWGTLLYIY